MTCVFCLQGMPQFCVVGGCETAGITEEDNWDEENWRRPKRHRKRRATLKDEASTGRKEAARLYPLDPQKDCEWGGKFNQGGGKHPVAGCGTPGRPDIQKQSNRHHGPDKSTLNNERGNVHRICPFCHNSWHAKNDPDYDPGEPVKGD